MKVGRIMESEKEKGKFVNVRRGEVKGGEVGKARVEENEKQVKIIQK